MNPEFIRTFSVLKAMLKEYEGAFAVSRDTDEEYYLNTLQDPGKPGQQGFFGAVHIKKNYVSFYLIPVYCFPELLDTISPALRKRMQGKSCFNFKKAEPELFDELHALIHRSLENSVKRTSSD